MKKCRNNTGRERIGKRLVASALALCMAAGLTACGSKPGEDEEKQDGNAWELSEGIKNLMEGIQVQAAVPKTELEEEALAAISDFSIRLFQQCVETDAGNNTIVAPVSVIYALAMTANGAKGETLGEMETVLGMSVEELNATMPGALFTYDNAKYKLSLANSIWFTEEESRNFTPNQDFLQKNADCYGAEIYQTVLDDAAKDAINAWVTEKTDGMIENILDEIPDDAIMYLINAVAFDAEWQKIYSESGVREDVFYTASGEEQTVEFMYSEESTYLEDEHAVGMLKYYSGRKYAFVAMLPKEGMSVEEYLNTLDGTALQKLLTDTTPADVDVALPKFTCEADYEMSEILSGMGMPLAFDACLADLSGIGTVPEDRNLSISRVIHKAKIEVDERGTKAGAATVVEVTDECAMEPRERKTVVLNRPFVYMIIDCQSRLPIFMGTVTNLQ